ncbi:ArgE/DapE family deacylase [Aerophototrophica crusticola]|uniref:Probable succinyl-diaminopimelate desuccinylase n=1 Tax=Aerophototrophica crusticola TaxID=1709002 RepID=A0A858R2Z1_9PROT|nr:ArgE/DapE family deacylase [Rhodospirillaceae bacterium B3]
MTADAIARLDRFVTEHLDQEVEFLRQVVRVPSDNPSGNCAPHAAATVPLLEALGFTVEQHPVPADLVKAVGMVSATNLIVRHRFGPGPTIALNAHGDVVPPGEGWTVDPYGGVVRDDALYGRGAAVSKSDFATYAYALLALKSLGEPLAGTVELHLTYDEETGGEIGPKWLIEQGLTKPDLAICASFAHSVVVAHNGCLHLEVKVRGKIAHAALPHTGRDALEAATAILNALYAYRKGLSATTSSVNGITHPTLVVGLIKGGVNTNVVPDLVTLRLDRRMVPEEDAAKAEQALRDVIARAAATLPGITVEVTRVLLAKPLAPLPGSDRLAGVLAVEAERLLGHPVPQVGVPLYTDARHYAEAGIPTVLFGAGPKTILEAGAHGADEHVRISDLEAATKAVAAGLYRLMA